MKLILTAAFLLSATFITFSQPINSRLKLEQGQTVSITQQIKSHITQQAGGQAIDFTIDATGEHTYKVTHATTDNNTLHYQFVRLSFAFDGWGKKMNFDSKNETDLNGMFGAPVKDMMGKNHTIIIDTNGKVLRALPEKIELAESDNRMAVIHNLLKDVFAFVQPPVIGKASFFKVLPGKPISQGDTWTESWQTENGKFDAAYALSGINDTTLIIDFAASSVTVVKAEMMGTETTTTMNNKSTGQIILDRLTGILKEKTEMIESHGNTESSFGTLPVTSKSTITMRIESAK